MTRWRKHVVMLASGGLLAGLAIVAPAAVAGPAAFTSVDIGIDGAGHCVHGNPAINCNAYDGKQFVWLNGGPLTAVLGDGDYFFAVVSSGGQSDPNDPQSTNDNLLSSDAYTDRSFNISGGVFSYSGPHQADGTKIRLVPYDTTAHVYHLMICKLENGLQPEKKSCKSDAFKVKEGDGSGGGFSAPSADKTAEGTHTRNVAWTIDKSADQTVIHSGSPVETHYTVMADKTISNEQWGVEGTITVTNTNDTDLDVSNVVENLATDEPSLGAHCTVGPPTSGTVPAQAGNPPVPGTLDFDYSCSFDNEPDYTETYLNSATVSYTNPDTQTTDTVDAVMTFTVPEEATLDEGSDPECVVVSDTNADPVGSPGTGTTVCDDATFNYSITFFNNLCVDYPNTATMATEDEVQPDGWPRTDDWTVTFCGPNAGGKTQGWWQNKNGQALLKANLSATNGPCETLTSYVSGHTGSGDLINADSSKYGNQLYNTGQCAAPTTAFSYLPSFDLKVFAVGTCSGNCWSMLLSQWLTTLLDTAAYPTTIKAGGPALTSGAHIYNPDLLLGLDECTTIGELLAAAVDQFPTYKNDKATVSAVSGMFDRINNNVQPSCVPGP